MSFDSEIKFCVFYVGAEKNSKTPTERLTSSSAMAERPREVGDSNGVCQFEAKF